MGRYRPPAPKPSTYITANGYCALQDELKALWKKRAVVTAALSAAAAEGDRSENAEYIYRKKELAGIDRRIRYIQRRLPLLKVVSQPPSRTDQVFFGATVVLENLNGDQTCYRIVGPDEFDTAKGWISMDSPMARALMKKMIDDEIIVTTPTGEIVYDLVSISYEFSNPDTA